MCRRITERYAVCGCIYLTHGIDQCPYHIQPDHQIREREVLVGYACSRHTSSSVEPRNDNLGLRNTHTAFYKHEDRDIQPKAHAVETRDSVLSISSARAHDRAQYDTEIALSNLAESQAGPDPTSQRQRLTILPPCYILLFLGALTIAGSLASALWRVVEFDDLSGGFTLAQYTLGVGVFVTGSMTAIHSRTCHCWRHWGSSPDTTRGTEDDHSPQ